MCNKSLFLLSANFYLIEMYLLQSITCNFGLKSSIIMLPAAFFPM